MQGGATMIAGDLSPNRLDTVIRTCLVAVAVNAIMQTCDGIKLLNSPIVPSAVLNVSAL